ncbi:MAG TPA: DNA gyrase C-terminal beta-propeller domain-containing protein, partial [Rhabdochlamydiaceae bacterium]|nr:DNA gyrase C-terminal beta-propeller domain-containing protein [Rhabdochlamydiaceae bacterium]
IFDAEYQDLLKKISYYRDVLASENLVRGIIKEELDEVKKRHLSDRKTKILPAEGEFNIEDLIKEEQVIIALSEDDYIKRMPVDTFREQRRGGQGVVGMDMKRETDVIKDIYIASTHDTLLIFTTLGRCYWLKAWQIPEAARRTKGKPLINLLEDLSPGEKVAAVLCVKSFEEPGTILLATKKGVVKKTELSAFSSQRRKGVYAINIDENDEVIAARLCQEGKQIMLFTRNGMAVRFDQAEIRPIGRVARGVRGILLRGEDNAVVSCEVVTEEDSILIVSEKGYGKRSKVGDFRQTRRGGVGVRSIIASERNGMVVSAIAVKDSDSVVLISLAGQTLRISMKDVRVMGRSTQGVRLVQLKEDDKLVAVQKIGTIENEQPQ